MLWLFDIFHLFSSESGSRGPMNPDPIWIRIRNTARHFKIVSGAGADILGRLRLLFLSSEKRNDFKDVDCWPYFFFGYLGTKCKNLGLLKLFLKFKCFKCFVLKSGAMSIFFLQSGFRSRSRGKMARLRNPGSFFYQ